MSSTSTGTPTTTSAPPAGTADAPGTTDTAVTPERLVAARRAVVSSSIGNALEWFDIIVYASFATVIGAVFFPEGDETLGLVLTFATFAISYAIRPIGAMVLGSYADRHGRRAGLTLTIALMTLGVLLMAAAPTAAMIGPAAGLVILLSRLVQGFSAGGEFGTATTFLVETAPHRRAYYASWQVASQGGAMLLASLFGYVLHTSLTDEQLHAWGWRVPFAFGLLIGPVGWYIRRRLDETDEFTASEPPSSPLGETFRTHLGRVLAAAAAVGVATISVYLILYMPTYAVKSLGLPSWSGYVGGIVAGVVTLVGVPFVGHLADRVGPTRIMVPAAVAALVLAWPLFALLVSSPSVLRLTVMIAVLGVIMALYFGPLPALLVDLFPTRVRTTGMALAYNVGVTLLGGVAPLVLTWLISSTGSKTAPSLYYVVVAVLSLVGLTVLRRRYGAR